MCQGLINTCCNEDVKHIRSTRSADIATVAPATATRPIKRRQGEFD